MPVSRRHVATGVLGVLLMLASAPSAFAHADLVSSSPEDGAILETPPATVTLTFSEGLDAGKSSVRLVGPDGGVATGRPSKDGATVMRLVDLALVPGDYTVKWVAATDDGHIERGELGFTVRPSTPSPVMPSTTPAPSQAPAATPVAAPSAGASSSAAAATATADPVPVAANGSGGDVLLPIALGLALVAVVGVFVLRRSRGV